MNLKNIVRWRNIIIFIAVSALWSYSCNNEDGDKIVTPDPNEENENEDPSFDAADWMIFR